MKNTFAFSHLLVLTSSVFYQIILPQLTWFFILSTYYFPKTLLIWSLPIFFSSASSSLCLSYKGLLRRMAELKGLQVHIEDAKLTSGDEQVLKGNEKCVDHYIGHKEQKHFGHTQDDAEVVWNDETCPTMYGFHPHNKFPIDIFLLLASDPHYDNLSMAQSSLGKFIPTISFPTFLFGNVIDATRRSMESAMVRKNRDIGLFPGGAREMVECQPNSNNRSSKTITLVKHGGFLKIARALGVFVTPTFIFNFSDAYFSPFSKLERWMYEKFKFTLPLFFSTEITSVSRRPAAMHVGAKIDTSLYTSDRALLNDYYMAVKEIFEKHKGEYPGYEEREIAFAGGLNCAERRGSKTATSFNMTSMPVPKRKLETQGQKVVLTLSLFLVGWSTYEYFLHGNLWKMSTWSAHKVNKASTIMVHVLSSLVWVSASFYLTTHQYSKKTHKAVGSLGMLSAVAMCCSANYLQMTSLAASWAKDRSVEGVLDQHVHRVTTMGTMMGMGIPKFPHTEFHAACNFQISNVVMYLLAFSIARARMHDIPVHKKYAENVSLLIGASIMPRLLAVVIRFIFPTLGGEAAFTVACGMFIVMQVNNMSKLKVGITKNVLGIANSFSLGVVVLELGVEGMMRYWIPTGICVGVGWLMAGFDHDNYGGVKQSRRGSV